MSNFFVAVLMGSDSDLPVMEATFAVLKSLQIPFEARITSAHRTPETTREFVLDAEARGCAVFIAAAGMAAHLAGAVSAITVRPVIGVPMNASLDGMDALLSTVQMPAGIPVASVAIGKVDNLTGRIGVSGHGIDALGFVVLSHPWFLGQIDTIATVASGPDVSPAKIHGLRNTWPAFPK